MPILNEIDPFSQVFNALWQLIDNCKPLNGYTIPPGAPGANAVVPALVMPGNKIKFNLPTDRDPIKNSAQDADYPELLLVPTGVIETNLTNSSCTTKVSRQYSWWLTTGDFRTNYRLFPVQWAVVCAMADFSTVLSPLTYDGELFVKRVQVGSAVEGVNDQRLNRNIRGWSSIWSCTVDMYFKQSILRLYNGGITPPVVP